jgi:hypothetical protein
MLLFYEQNVFIGSESQRHSMITGLNIVIQGGRLNIFDFCSGLNQIIL